MRTNRLNKMEEYILNNGSVSLTDLSDVFEISMNTVRRDVAELLERGNILKVYGGVAANTSSDSFLNTELLPFSQRVTMNSVQKQLIGKLAAELVEDGSTIFLDSGSTVPYMLPHLADKKGITVVTHSLYVMFEAAKFPSLDVLALGGRLNHPTFSYIDSPNSSIKRIHVQTLFMGASAVSDKWGVGNNTYEEFRMKEDLTNRFDNIVVLADSSKFDRVARYTFCELRKISGIVTDRPPSSRFMQAVKENGIRLYLPENI